MSYISIVCMILLWSFQASIANERLADFLEITFVVSAIADNSKTYIHNDKLAHSAFSPCSTFKVPHAIFALAEQVITDESNLQLFDESKYPVKDTWPDSWTKSNDLSSALNNSVVWYFQNIAKEIGHDRMQNYLAMINYGNQDITGGLTNFWLSSSLRITPVEQIEVWQRLFSNDIFNPDLTSAVQKRILLEETNTYKIYAKTGACQQDKDKFGGWLVGFVENSQGIHYFALYQQGDSFDKVIKNRLELAKEMLFKYNLL